MLHDVVREMNDFVSGDEELDDPSEVVHEFSNGVDALRSSIFS